MAETSGESLARDESNIEQNKDSQTTRNGLLIAQIVSRTEQAETRTEQAETRTEQAKTRTEQAETRLEQAETRTELAETRTEQAETRTERAETRTEQAEARMERSEEAIRESELNYRRLFEAARDGILILDADTGRVTDVNPFLVNLLGYPENEIVGKTVGELSPFKDLVSNQTMWERLQRDGYARYENQPLETRDGRAIVVEFVSNVYRAGEKKAIQCNIRDLTERRRSEARLNASFREIGVLKSALDEHLDSIRLAAIVESSQDAIIGKDLEGVVTSWNKSAEKIFGYTAAEMKGTSLMRLIPSEFRGEEVQILAKVKRGEKIEHYDTVRLTKDGRRIDISVTLSPIKDIAGNVVGVSKIARDITELKAAEKLRELNIGLEQSVAERTEQLQAVNQELEAFSYSVSHDLRAPLRHLVGFVAMLHQDAGPTLSEKSLRYLETISQSARRMGKLIDDLLAFSRTGRAGVKKSEVNLDLLIPEIVADLSGDISGRKINWIIHPLPVLWADRALLRQVLINLISNSVKFTGGRTEATIEIGPIPGGDNENVTFIRDNGAGFDPRYAGKLFGVFQRLHSETEFEGTGIGLANVERIIKRHGGRVWAEGAVDVGATFFFSIPKHEGAIINGG